MEPRNFYPRPPRGGRHFLGGVYSDSQISIHALREEGDAWPTEAGESVRHFYPRPPRGGRPRLHRGATDTGNFYPRPPRGGRQGARKIILEVIHISIHALREEGDPVASTHSCAPSVFLSTPSARRATTAPSWTQRPSANFYPRPPRGGRLPASIRSPIFFRFLSTPSARRATHSHTDPQLHSINFYPRPPRGGRRPDDLIACAKVDFYPRPPRGGRLLLLMVLTSFMVFLSTPSARRATIRLPSAYPPLHISIHALREEGDAAVDGDRPRDVSISIHALREEGDEARPARWTPTSAFLSTPSARRATRGQGTARLLRPISIHALREEGDGDTKAAFAPSHEFLSTPSARRATRPTMWATTSG